MEHRPAQIQKKPLEQCVICLEEISERAVAVPCNHLVFDFVCLVSWLQGHSTCPLCKTELTEVQYDWRSPTDYKTYLVTHTSTSSRARETRPYAGGQQIYRRSRRQHPRGRQPPHASGPPLTPDAAILRRRLVYRRKLYSLHVGTNRLSRFKDFTPESFARSSELQSRARNWIRRELQVFEFLSVDSATGSEGISTPSRRANNAEFLLEYIISVLRTVDIKGSAGRAEELLTDFLGLCNSRLFLHELNQWLRSPYTNLSDWDRHLQYAADLSDSRAADYCDIVGRLRENKTSTSSLHDQG